MSRLQAIAAAAITGFMILVTISAIAPDAAQAVTYRSVSGALFTGSTQLSDCNAWEWLAVTPGNGTSIIVSPVQVCSLETQ